MKTPPKLGFWGGLWWKTIFFWANINPWRTTFPLVQLVLWNIHKQKYYKQLYFWLNLLSHMCQFLSSLTLRQCCNVNFEWDMTENCWYSAEKSLVGGRGHLITVSLLLRLLLWNFWLLNNLDLDFDQDMTWTRNVLDWTGPDLDWTWTWSLTILLFINNLSYNIPNSTHAYDIGEISFYFGTSLQYFSLWIAEFVWCHLWVQTLKKSFRTTEMHLKISRSWMRRNVEFQRLWKSTLFSDHHCAYFTEYGITMASTNDEIVETAYQVVAKRDQTKQ